MQRGAQNKAGGNSQPPVAKEAAATQEKNTRAGTTTKKYKFAQQEPLDYYHDCLQRGRNAGLYFADQNPREDRGATSTRQDRNGNRYGLECPEERDYFPYWHPTPWHDIAVFTSESSRRCDYYRSHSQNVSPKIRNEEGDKHVSTTSAGVGLKLVDRALCLDNEVVNETNQSVVGCQ